MREELNSYGSQFDIDQTTGEILFNRKFKEHIKLPCRAFIGNNILFRLADIIPGISNAKCILVATYKNAFSLNANFHEIRRSLKNFKNRFIFFNKIEEPTVATIKNLSDVIRKESVDLIIALGGGTVIDVAKAAAGLALQSGEIEDYLLNKKPFNSDKNIQMIAVPTIVSSGSEGNDCAVYITTGDLKTSIRGLKVPFVIIDPLILSSVPSNQATITGLDGFCQVIEAFMNPNSNTFNDLLSLESIRLFNKNLPPYLEGITNETVLWELSIAGYLHAISNFNVTYEKGGLGLAHSLVHLCNKYRIAHGNMVAILLPSTLRFLLLKSSYAAQKLQGLCEVFHISVIPDDQAEAPHKAIDYIENFIKFFLRRGNLPITLQEAEVKLYGYIDIIDSEKPKIVNGHLNLDIDDEHLLMILRGKQDFSKISSIREKILLDISKIAAEEGAFTADFQELQSIEQVLVNILSNYHFIHSSNVRRTWKKSDRKDIYEQVDRFIQKKYKYEMKKVEGRDRFLGIC